MPERTIQVVLSGAVQGCGVRPALARLAARRNWNGSVRNTTAGVELILSGELPDDERLAGLIRDALPREAALSGLTFGSVARCEWKEFLIEESDGTGSLAAPIPRDVAICGDCLAETHDSTNRRFLYPFTSCAECGPRYSLLLSMPFDRERTTMGQFDLCGECLLEYDDPSNRRFHAQTICCPECGPHVWATDYQGHRLASHDEAVRRAAEAIRDGRIIAMKGVGGYQLLADATSSRAVAELRRRKQRPAKPLAVLCRSLDDAHVLAYLSEVEERQLTSRQNPIVLVRQRPESHLAPEVNPGLSDIEYLPRLNRPVGWTPRPSEGSSSDGRGVHPTEQRFAGTSLGLLLPTTALHDRLAELAGRPLICTSGNRGGEPLASRVDEAQQRLRDVADLFLHHDRDISQPIDDSVVRVIANRPVTIRCARGIAPLSLTRFAEGWPGLERLRETPESQSPGLPFGPAPATQIRFEMFHAVMAVGGHQKSAIALSNGSQMLLGPHVGDLDTVVAQEEWCERLRRLSDLAGGSVKENEWPVAHDPHPDYFSTRWSTSFPANRLSVWHHHAHIVAGMLEHQWLDRTVLGVAFDGTGLGPDGTIWGGEFLIATATQFQRVAHLRPFGLPGGDAAITDLRRLTVSMLSQLEELSSDEIAELTSLTSSETRLIQQALPTEWTPRTTSCGRLFDAAACLILQQTHSAYEGQAAMSLEAACDPRRMDASSVRVGQHGRTRRPSYGETHSPNTTNDDEYSFAIVPSEPLELDWRPVLRQIIADRRNGVRPAVMAMKFHRGLATAIRSVCDRWPDLPVVLGGGVFQNRVLVELLADAWPTHRAPLGLPGVIPPNDGGLAAGQLVVAMRTLIEERDREPCALESPVASSTGSTAIR